MAGDREQCLQIITQKIFMRRKLKMEVKKENITRNEINQYLCFNLNYEKEKEEEEKGDMGQILAQMKRAKGCIQQHYW